MDVLPPQYIVTTMNPVPGFENLDLILRYGVVKRGTILFKKKDRVYLQIGHMRVSTLQQ